MTDLVCANKRLKQVHVCLTAGLLHFERECSNNVALTCVCVCVNTSD